MFLLVSVILFTGGRGCLPQCMLGYHPPRADTPREQTPLEQIPPRADIPQIRHPPEQIPPSEQTPWNRHPPSIHPLPPEQTPPRSRHSPPPASRLRHTVNEPPVRILLECILVQRVNVKRTHIPLQ